MLCSLTHGHISFVCFLGLVPVTFKNSTVFIKTTYSQLFKLTSIVSLTFDKGTKIRRFREWKKGWSTTLHLTGSTHSSQPKKAQHRIFYLLKLKKTGLSSASDEHLQSHNRKHSLSECNNVVRELYDLACVVSFILFYNRSVKLSQVCAVHPQGYWWPWVIHATSMNLTMT